MTALGQKRPSGATFTVLWLLPVSARLGVQERDLFRRRLPASAPCCGGEAAEAVDHRLVPLGKGQKVGHADAGEQLQRLFLQRPVLGMHEGHVEEMLLVRMQRQIEIVRRWRAGQAQARWDRWRRLPASGGTCCGKIGRTRSRRRHGRGHRAFRDRAAPPSCPGADRRSGPRSDRQAPAARRTSRWASAPRTRIGSPGRSRPYCFLARLAEVRQCALPARLLQP